MVRRLLAVFIALPACTTVFDVDGWKEDVQIARTADGAEIRHGAVCSFDEEVTCFSRVIVDSENYPLATTSPSGYGPADLRDAYKIADSGAGAPGTGSSAAIIAIVDAYGYPNAEADLAVYRQQFGLPPCTTANGCFMKVDQDGGTAYPRTDTGWAQEAALDLDMASAMCPSCKLILVQAKTASYANLATAVDTAARLRAHVISNSYGGNEVSGYDQHYTHPGIAITASSGDSGYGVSYPASSPNVTAVGGTSLTKAASTRGWSETAWDGAGSGCSALFAKPSWQKDTGCTNRTVADVSAIADPATGVAVYGPATRRRSAWMVFGGTSVAAPLIAGIYGVNGGTVSAGSDPYAHTSALFDVTSGSNGNCGGSYLCTAGVGYDGPTGLGTPNGSSAF